MTEEMVREVFDLECRIIRDLADTPMCIPMGRKVKVKLRSPKYDVETQL